MNSSCGERERTWKGEEKGGQEKKQRETEGRDLEKGELIVTHLTRLSLTLRPEEVFKIYVSYPCVHMMEGGHFQQRLNVFLQKVGVVSYP